MTALILNATSRDGQTKAKALRHTGLIPAVLYGHGLKNQSLALDAKGFFKLYGQVGESSLIDLVIDNGQPVSVLVKDVQYDLLAHTPIHVDLQQVKMDEKITAEIELVLTGEAPAVKNLGAVIVESLNKLKVECLPGELQHQVLVDIGQLAEFGQTISIGDLKLPASWKLIGHELTDVVVSVVAPRAEVEEAPAAAAPAEGEAVPTAEGEAKAEETKPTE